MATTNELMELVRNGMDVYDSSGRKLGEVGEVNIGTRPDMAVTSKSTTEERSFFEVEQGVLGFSGGFWVPGGAVRKVGEDSVTLRYTEDEARERGWETRPTTPEPRDNRDVGLFGL